MSSTDPDAALRIACFEQLRRLGQEFGEDIPYKGGLDRGFQFNGQRVPFLAPAKGIFRAAIQKGPAALSVNTSYETPYDDAPHDTGFAYAYRSGDIDQPDNRALRSAGAIGAPLVYFVGTRPGWYQPLFPVFVIDDHAEGRHVILGVGGVIGMVVPGLAVAPIDDEVERAWAVRTARVRVHQARFRGLVLPAYKSQCAICRLKEARLLDAAHIVEDKDPKGVAAVRNGLSLCSIHHRAFDSHLVGVDPNFRVEVADRLLHEEDGPMLELLKGFHAMQIVLPERPSHRPSKDHLAMRYELFKKAG